MSVDFDPYHKWLGIAPKFQPPDHYRLLGIDQFEDDPEVIDMAANRQMAYVQGMAAGEHSKLTQKILKELAIARVQLMDAEKKAAYDAELREENAPAEEAAPSPDEGGIAPPPVADAPPAAPAPSPTQDLPPIDAPAADEAPPVAVPAAIPVAAPIMDAADEQKLPPLETVAEANERPKPVQPQLVDKPTIQPADVRTVGDQPPARPKPVQPKPSTRPGRASSRPRKKSNPALVVAGSALAIALLAGVAYVASGNLDDGGSVTAGKSKKAKNEKTRIEIKTSKKRNQQNPNTEPNNFEAHPPNIERQDEPNRLSGPERAEIALKEGRLQQAVSHLRDFESFPQADDRFWAQAMLSEIEEAGSDQKAFEFLRQLNGNELERLAEGKLSLDDKISFSYPAIAGHFKNTVRRNLEKVFDLQRENTPRPNPSDNPQRRQAAKELLASRGLRQQEQFWISKNDDELIEAGGRFEAANRSARESSGQLENLIRQVQSLQNQIVQAQRNKQQEQVNRLQNALRETMGQYQNVLTKFASARNTVTIEFLRAARQVNELQNYYGRLLKDQEVQEALEVLEARLAPTPQFVRNRNLFAPFEKELMTNRTLGFWGENNEVFRVDVIVNDRASGLFQLRPKAEFNLIPERTLREAGVEINKREQFDVVVGKTKFRTSKVKVPSLRIGKVVSENVTAYVLPDNQKRVPAFLNDTAFPRHRLETKRGQFVLTVNPR